VDAQTGSLRVARAAVDVPAQSSDWIVHEVDQGGVGAQSSLAVLDDRLVVAYRDGVTPAVRVARALAAAPGQASDWAVSRASPENGYNLSTTVVQGRLAVGYYDNVSKTTRVARAKVAAPAADADWQLSTVDAGIIYSSTTFGDQLAIAYVGGPHDLFVARSSGCW
jgi:hypothetical protein